MPNYELSQQHVNNIKLFFDRIHFSRGYKGIKEVDAIKEIIHLLDNPLTESKQKSTK